MLEEKFGCDEDLEEDELDFGLGSGVFTQESTQEGSFGETQYLKNEQQIISDQISLFKEQQKLLSDSLKMRNEIASKRFKK